MTTLKRILFASICLITSHLAYAQEGGKQYQLVLKSNDTLTVNLVDTDETSVTVFNIKTGRKARISKKSIISFKPIDTVEKPVNNAEKRSEEITKLQKDFEKGTEKDVIIVKDNEDEDTEYARVITKSNDTLVVKIVSRNKDYFTVYNLKTAQNSRIAMNDISGIERVEKEKTTIKKKTYHGIVDVPIDSYYYRHSTRNNVTPSALPLKTGEGYYQNIWAVYNNIHFGITDELSAGVGMVIFPGLFEDIGLPLEGHIKYAGQVANKWHLGIDVLALHFPKGSKKSRTAFMGVTTYGDRRNNLSLGFGVQSLKSSYRSESMPYMTAASQIQIVDDFFFVGDAGWGFGSDNSGLILSLGVRFKFKSMSADVFFMNTDGNENSLGLIASPLNIGFTTNFWKKGN